jgi:hypothetical protein
LSVELASDARYLQRRCEHAGKHAGYG